VIKGFGMVLDFLIMKQWLNRNIRVGGIILIQVYDFSHFLLFLIYLGKIILGFEFLIVKYMFYIFEIMEY
jgi:hypothetical protein